MRGCVAILTVLLTAGPGFADWRAMSGAEITEALTDTRLVYAEAWQEFYASGRTLYNAGADSWGYWDTRSDRYCSQWPPAGGWACYDMQRNDATGALRFIGESGDVTEGRVAE
ncbi:MAG: hypothetical protein QNJ09_18100 [Paracoccaceae bacterium]|nr:hypothetical protein [Paracoccaceae bacterium]